MKRTILALATAACLAVPAAAGDIKAGSVPGSINYQGRLERDNAPVTGAIHIIFRIYDAASSGTLIWTSPELVAAAAQGIFSASITPGWQVLAGGRPLYLEVQVEGDILTPREPLSSVAFALAARKLEDGSSVSVTTLTAAYQVLLATTADSMVGIGTDAPTYKLTVNGTVRLNGVDGKLCFPTGNCLNDALVATGAGGISAPGNAMLESGNLGTGLMSFNTGNVVGTRERMRINDFNNNGTVAIGPAAITTPKAGVLDVDGLVYVSTWGVSERNAGPVPFNGNITVKGGRVTGADADYVTIGETSDVIALVSGGGERLRVHSNGFVGVNNAAPAYRLDVTGDMHTNTGLLASEVSAGAYTGWPSASNEVRAVAGKPLLLQQNSTYNVGVGTDTPREKLHVRGSVRADYGVIAATAAIAGNATVGGDFTANGNNRNVYLTSTTIYGTLTVTGGMGSMAGNPAYTASSNTFSGQNTFLNQVTVSSDVVTPNRLGAAMKDFNFPGSRYLQVGDNKPEYATQNTYAYLVGGDSANSRLAFYRGSVEAGNIGSHNGANIGLVIAGSTKTLADATYYRIQNSVVWISTGYNSTPGIYVSSQMGNVGIGTVVSDPNYKLTVDGSLHIIGTGNGIVFPNGSVMTSATLGSASSLANSGDAVVAANTGGGGGSVILRSGSVDGLVVDSGGNVGIGTLNPVSKINIRGGDLVLGTPINPYAADGAEDLIVGGNVVFDGALIQRSASATQFSNLVVAGDVFLSTGTARKTGIATNSPVTTLDVAGNAQFGSATAKSTFTAAGVLQLASPLGTAYGGTGTSTGNSPTASALAADPTDCSLPNVALGINASGVAQCSQPSDVSGNAATATKLATARTINGTSFDGSGNITVPVNSTNDAALNSTVYPLWTGVAGNNSAYISVGKLSFVPNTGVLTAAGFSGPVSGNATTASALAADPTDCSLPNVALGINASGVAQCAQPSNVTGNAGTASALAADPTDCSLPNVALGINAAGVAQCGQPSNVTGTAANVTGTVAVGNGGTGSTTASGARTNLGLVIGTNVQAYDADLSDIAALSGADGNFIVGSPTGWTTESGSTARTSLGLGGGMSGVMTIRNAGGTADCTVTFSNGIATGTTCSFI